MYKHAAEKVKKWRRDHGEMNQVEFAELADVSVGCLQGFEAATRSTREKNLRKIAAAIGLPTVDALLSEDVPITKTDPLVEGLDPEDLRHAHRYHRAGAEAKLAAKDFLGTKITDEVRERIANVLLPLLRHQQILLPGVEAVVRAVDADADAKDGLPPALPAPDVDEQRPVGKPRKR